MKIFRDRIAVITGGASGLGRALAELKAQGVSAIGHRTDVSKGDEVERLATAALAAFGAVHIVCNNAGVAPLGAVWENAEADWRWALGVNLWGVIHGVRVFTPIL